jgi:hypothetical protein
MQTLSASFPRPFSSASHVGDATAITTACRARAAIRQQAHHLDASTASHLIRHHDFQTPTTFASLSLYRFYHRER